MDQDELAEPVLRYPASLFIPYAVSLLSAAMSPTHLASGTQCVSGGSLTNTDTSTYNAHSKMQGSGMRGMDEE